MASSEYESNRKYKKLVVVGDGMCGKTCLLFAFKDDQFIPTHEQTIFDTYVVDIKVDKKTVSLALFDTAGQEEYDRLRALSYTDTKVVLLCFSVDNPTSVENVVKTWVPEIQEFCELCPVILVACKKDLRTDPQTIAELKKTGENPVTRERGLQLAAEMKADAYMECSAKTREGVQDLFLYAARLSLRKRSRKLSTISCVLY